MPAPFRFVMYQKVRHIPTQAVGTVVGRREHAIDENRYEVDWNYDREKNPAPSYTVELAEQELEELT